MKKIASIFCLMFFVCFSLTAKDFFERIDFYLEPDLSKVSVFRVIEAHDLKRVVITIDTVRILFPTQEAKRFLTQENARFLAVESNHVWLKDSLVSRKTHFWGKDQYIVHKLEVLNDKIFYSIVGREYRPTEKKNFLEVLFVCNFIFISLFSSFLFIIIQGNKSLKIKRLRLVTLLGTFIFWTIIFMFFWVFKKFPSLDIIFLYLSGMLWVFLFFVFLTKKTESLFNAKRKSYYLKGVI